MALAPQGLSRDRVRSRVWLLAAGAAALLALMLLSAGAGTASVRAVSPTLSPLPEGRHVFDYGNLMSPGARSIAENLAGDIEAHGGGRVVVYTADLLDLPASDEIASAWQVDGLLLTGWDSMGSTVLGKTLTDKVPAQAAQYLGSTRSISVGFESWATSTLARAAGFLEGSHVFDGTGILSSSDSSYIESVAVNLGASIGTKVYVDVALGQSGDPYGTAFSNATDLSSNLDGSLVIAMAVSGKTLGGFVESNSTFGDAYATGDPWLNSSISNQVVPSGDLGAALIRAVDGVGLPPDPARALTDAASGVTDAVSTFLRDFAGNPVNQRWSIAGLLAAFFSIVAFRFDRWRRRRDGGYGDDDSVMLPAPPTEMTPALAALMSAPLDTTRAVTAALLDLAAHGFIAFYQPESPFSSAGLAVVSRSGAASRGPIHSSATERPLGRAEAELLEGLRSWSGSPGQGSADATHDFATLRPLFEATAERLEQIAGSYGWLNLRPDIASRAWLAYGAVLLAATAAMALIWQPIAAVALWYAAYLILPGAFRMPLPFRTREGQMTSATVDAYRRTLKRALSARHGTVPPWLANAEEAALWGYAWGLEGDVQDFVARNVAAAMDVDLEDADAAAGRTAHLRRLATAIDSTRATGGTRLFSAPARLRTPASWHRPARRPIGLDTMSIGRTLGLLGAAVAPAPPNPEPPPGSSPPPDSSAQPDSATHSVADPAPAAPSPTVDSTGTP